MIPAPWRRSSASPRKSSRDAIHTVAKEGPIALANFNTPEQTVISGAPELVARAGNVAKAEGARVVPSKVSGAWHSPRWRAPLSISPPPWRTSISRPLGAYLPQRHRGAGARPPTAAPGHARQLTSPVRWAELILNLQAAGVDTWVEVGAQERAHRSVRKILPQEPKEFFFLVENSGGLEKLLVVG